MITKRSPAPYGFDLTQADHRLLRTSPPAEALRWCAAAIAPGAEIVRVQPLAGGMSSAVHAVDVEDGRRRAHRLVLRRMVRPELLEEEPDILHREATVLEVVRGCALPTPELVALDADAEATDVPALLMTRVPGSVDWRPTDLDGYLRRLAGALPAIHATPVSVPVRAYAPYELEMHRPPRWSSRPELWTRAFELLESPPPAAEPCFIHRDYHPGNVLWAGGAVSGVVDWLHASVGSPMVDVGHCRGNLGDAFGMCAADRFLELYLAASGRDDEYHPYWDVAAALGGLREDDPWAPDAERFLAHALDARAG